MAAAARLGLDGLAERDPGLEQRRELVKRDELIPQLPGYRHELVGPDAPAVPGVPAGIAPLDPDPSIF